MKKVNVVTFCDWRSYGSMLQALGLQHMLKDLGFAGQVLRPEPQPPAQLKPRLPLAGGLGQRIVDLHKLLNHGAQARKYRSSNAFIQQNIPICYCGSYDAVKNDPPKADVYLSGSDQVWQPGVMDPFLFLDFVPEGIPKISYAASMGIPVIPPEREDLFRRFISGYSYLSVREADNQPVISALTDKPVHRHIDPVFLMERENWRLLETAYPGMDKPYILVYAIYWEKALNKELKRLHEQTGMDVVVVASSLRKMYANKWIYDADPGQFLWLVDHAAMVVTSSFHGVAMSAIFEKKFSAVINPGSPSRIACLLETLGIGNLPLDRLAEADAPDYEPVRQRIEQERQRSKDYLNEALAEI